MVPMESQMPQQEVWTYMTEKVSEKKDMQDNTVKGIWLSIGTMVRAFTGHTPAQTPQPMQSLSLIHILFQGRRPSP